MDSSTESAVKQLSHKITKLKNKNAALNQKNDYLAKRFDQLSKYNQSLGDELANLNEQIAGSVVIHTFKTRRLEQLIKEEKILTKEIRTRIALLSQQKDFSYACENLMEKQQQRGKTMDEYNDIVIPYFINGNATASILFLSEQEKILKEDNDYIAKQYKALKIIQSKVPLQERQEKFDELVAAAEKRNAKLRKDLSKLQIKIDEIQNYQNVISENRKQKHRQSDAAFQKEEKRLLELATIVEEKDEEDHATPLCDGSPQKKIDSESASHKNLDESKINKENDKDKDSDSNDDDSSDDYTYYTYYEEYTTPGDSKESSSDSSKTDYTFVSDIGSQYYSNLYYSDEEPNDKVKKEKIKQPQKENNFNPNKMPTTPRRKNIENEKSDSENTNKSKSNKEAKSKKMTHESVEYDDDDDNISKRDKSRRRIRKVPNRSDHTDSSSDVKEDEKQKSNSSNNLSKSKSKEPKKSKKSKKEENNKDEKHSDNDSIDSSESHQKNKTSKQSKIKNSKNEHSDESNDYYDKDGRTKQNEQQADSDIKETKPDNKEEALKPNSNDDKEESYTSKQRSKSNDHKTYKENGSDSESETNDKQEINHSAKEKRANRKSNSESDSSDQKIRKEKSTTREKTEETVSLSANLKSVLGGLVGGSFENMEVQVIESELPEIEDQTKKTKKKAKKEIKSLSKELKKKNKELSEEKKSIKSLTDNLSHSPRDWISVCPEPDAVHDLSLSSFNKVTSCAQTEVTGSSIDFHINYLMKQEAELSRGRQVREELENVQSLIEKAETEIAEAKAKSTKIDKKIVKAKSNLDTIRIGAESDKLARENTDKQRQAMHDRAKKLKRQLKERQTKFTALQERIDELERIINDLVEARSVLERDLKDLDARNKPEVVQLNEEVGAYKQRLDEADAKKRQLESLVMSKREAIADIASSDRMTQFHELTMGRFSLERRVHKWNMMARDTINPLQTIEAFSFKNAKKRKNLVEQLEKAERKKLEKDESTRELEWYAKMLADMIQEYNNKWRQV